MNKFKIIIFILIITILSSCTEDIVDDITPLPENGTITQEDFMLFPKSEYGYIGDPMPFYDNGTMNMFYLLDERRGSIGFHPFALLQTEDFLSWEDIGTVIPYVNSISSQDLALGTGSVIKDTNGLYHAFYTGHNSSGEMEWYEKIQHATSTDLVNWTKHPEDGFFGNSNDFRDPYIYFDNNSNEYWMLVTTRDFGGGVIKRYTSTDLVNWTDNGVFYRNTEGNYNMECPTLIEYNGYYYLSFSEQGVGNDRVVHYRYTDNIDNGFIIPEYDYFDGWGFYAGRIELFDNKLTLSGWVATKTLMIDGGDYMWGGNLVTHELYQNPDGTLSVKILSEIDNILNHEVKYDIFDINVDTQDNQYIFESNRGYNYLLFESLLERPTKLNFSIDITNATNFGITLNAYDSIIGDLNIYFNIEQNKLEFYKVDSNLISTSLPEISIDFNYSNTLDCTLITEGDILVLYVNNEIALTSRAYNMTDSPFGFFSIQSDVIISDVHFYE